MVRGLKTVVGRDMRRLSHDKALCVCVRVRVRVRVRV